MPLTRAYRSPRFVAAGPRRVRASEDRSVRSHQMSSQTVLHVLAQPQILRQLGLLRTSGSDLSFPLRGRGPVARIGRASGRISAQLPRDRRRRPVQPRRDRPHPQPLRAQDADPLAFQQGQVPAGAGVLRHRRPQQPATVRPQRSARLIGGMPPALRNHLVPITSDTPTASAACAVRFPSAI